ncbi:MAG TPA: hypothetical protein PKA58_07270 [Polyangium sp.]|nr:hypothetical protein [Polyangium sp.]
MPNEDLLTRDKRLAAVFHPGIDFAKPGDAGDIVVTQFFHHPSVGKYSAVGAANGPMFSKYWQMCARNVQRRIQLRTHSAIGANGRQVIPCTFARPRFNVCIKIWTHDEQGRGLPILLGKFVVCIGIRLDTMMLEKFEHATDPWITFLEM